MGDNHMDAVAATPATDEPQVVRRPSRWRVLKHVTSSVRAMNSKGFMASQAHVITHRQLGETLPGRLERRVTMIGAMLAPADKEGLIESGPAAETLQTNGEAIMNLLNNCLDSAMLSMGFAVAKAGILPALLTMAVSAYLNRYTLLLNVKANELAQTDPVSSDLGMRAFGNPGRIALIVLYSLFGFFCCVSYVTAASDALGGLAQLALPGEGPPAKLMMIACWALLLLPTTLVRSLKSVALLSFVAFLGCLVMILAITGCCIAELSTTGLPSVSSLAWLPPSASDFASAFPILLLIFSIQAGGGVVLATMRDTSPANIGAVSRGAYGLVYFLNFFIGLVAYVTFGERVQGNVLLNFSASSPMAVIARLALLVLVVLSFMIMMVPCKLALIELCFDANESQLEATNAQFYGVTLALNLAAVGTALVIPDLSIVLDLNGAVCTNLVAFLLPAALYVKIRADGQGKQGQGGAVAPLSAANLPYALIFAFGVLSLAVGLVPTVQGLS